MHGGMGGARATGFSLQTVFVPEYDTRAAEDHYANSMWSGGVRIY